MSGDDAAKPPGSFGPNLIGFYISCTAMAVAAAVLCVCLIVFWQYRGSGTIAAVAGVLLVAATIASWHYLRMSRRGDG